MADGGYHLPPTSLREELRKQYSTSKPLVEVTGILLVLSGLLLNIETTPDFAGKCLRLMQFFSLSGSLLLLSILLSDLLNVLHPLYRRFDRSRRLHGKDESINKLMHLAMLLLPISTLFFFLLTMFLYVIVSFTREALFLISVASWYFFVYYMAKSSRISGDPVFLVFIVFLLLFLIPILLYVIFFFPQLVEGALHFMRSSLMHLI